MSWTRPCFAPAASTASSRWTSPTSLAATTSSKSTRSAFVSILPFWRSFSPPANPFLPRSLCVGVSSGLTQSTCRSTDPRGKILPRGLDSVSDEFPEDALLRTTAMLTVGYSGADLANLLNEAGILAVRRNKPIVTMEEIETAMEKITVRRDGPSSPRTGVLAHVPLHVRAGDASCGVSEPVSSPPCAR